MGHTKKNILKKYVNCDLVTLALLINVLLVGNFDIDIDIFISFLIPL
jgi:hypothetical protein